jgi:Fic family protein
MVFEGAPDEAGVYRKHDIDVRESAIPRPPSHKVPALMKQVHLKLVQEQEGWDRSTPPDPGALLRFSAEIHQRLAFIHPFGDANGRVARLAMNHLLRRYGGGYVILPPISRSKEHFTALEAAHHGNLEPLVELSTKCLFRV